MLNIKTCGLFLSALLGMLLCIGCTEVEPSVSWERVPDANQSGGSGNQNTNRPGESGNQEHRFVVYGGIRYELDDRLQEAYVSQNSGIAGDVVIPENFTDSGKLYTVKMVGSRAFYLCDGITSVSLPDNITHIGAEAFAGCSQITSAKVDDRAMLGYAAYQGCTGLTTVILGSGVMIGSQAFAGCTGIREIHVSDTQPRFPGYGAFDKTTCEISTLFVPVGCAELYRTTWKGFVNIVER